MPQLQQYEKPVMVQQGRGNMEPPSGARHSTSVAINPSSPAPMSQSTSVPFAMHAGPGQLISRPGSLSTQQAMYVHNDGPQPALDVYAEQSSTTVIRVAPRVSASSDYARRSADGSSESDSAAAAAAAAFSSGGGAGAERYVQREVHRSSTSVASSSQPQQQRQGSVGVNYRAVDEGVGLQKPPIYQQSKQQRQQQRDLTKQQQIQMQELLHQLEQKELLERQEDEALQKQEQLKVDQAHFAQVKLGTWSDCNPT